MSEQWHDDHKKAIAEKWTQCPQISARKQELLSKWAIGQVGINALCEAHAHAEKELAELKADRVAISQQLSDALDALFVSNQKLAEARAEIERLKINTRCDLDLLAADTVQMNKMQDEIEAIVFVKKKAVEEIVFLNQEIERKDKLVEQMRDFIVNLSKQKTTDEMNEETFEDADFEGGYDYIVEDARRIKAAIEAAEKGE
jgi:chromosome segregation ATPase